MTGHRIGLVSPGAMGSAVARRLTDAGHEVLTALAGRSAASRARAEAAGMRDATDAELAACDMLLSIVPPAQAEGLVERLLPHLRAQERKPLFVDANALNPASKRALAARLCEAGCDMVDGAIIGPPPTGGNRVTTTFLSGPRAAEAMILDVPGCGASVLDGDVGAASALKMCYGGINKGVVGLASALIRAAHRHGAGDALRAEMQRSMPDLFARYQRQIPDMVPKAYRWVAEMEEISAFLGEDDAAAGQLFEAMAGLFAEIEADRQGDGREIAILERAVAPD
ncbi:MAG: NAD(P)-dependent oxidoreductase [Sphingobium sp.]|nr:NAD(P)-dependent oxidoreductase [Sphingobium sp.]